MKKLVCFVLSAAMLFALGACSNTGTSSEVSDSRAVIQADDIKTIGDVLAIDTDCLQTAYNDERLMVSFIVDHTPYQAVAGMTPEVSGQLQENSDANLDDYEKYSEEFNRIISPLAVRSFMDLTQYAMDQNTIDSLKGQTCKYFFDNGYELGSYSLADEPFVDMMNELFSYRVQINETSDSVDLSEDEVREFLNNATIKDITLVDFGYNVESIADQQG